MKITSFNLLSGLVFLTLAACQSTEPSILGVPKSQWNHLTLDQQNSIIAGYKPQVDKQR